MLFKVNPLDRLPEPVLTQLHQADQRWLVWRQGQLPPPKPVVQESTVPLGTPNWDVVICGGTLGILVGAALARRGWRVAILERGALKGREQEWNISRQELHVLVELELLSPAELEQAIAMEFNPNRIRFGDGPEGWVRDVLNVGVDPVFLLETVKQRFLQAGGTLLEHTAFHGAIVHPDGVAVQASQPLTTRLLLDAMGHFSSLVAQARAGQTPAGICLVVGTCAQGLPELSTGDLIVSFTPLRNHCQYFWEAFPAHDGRTTYLFTYVDLHPQRPSLATLFTDYFELLPQYQGIESLEELQIQRALFGLFPSYRESPLQFPWSRLLAIGDSSGIQSPLSFGGFGAMMRHLDRLVTGLQEALASDALSQSDLALLQPYQPNVSVTWLFQRAMSARVDQSLNPDQINTLLSVVFAAMQELGEPVLRPFLQDVVQFGPLFQTLAQVSWQHPGLIPRILNQVGAIALLDWLTHYGRLALYDGLTQITPLVRQWTQGLAPQAQYRWHRRFEAWQYGSGGDYHSSGGSVNL